MAPQKKDAYERYKPVPGSRQLITGQEGADGLAGRDIERAERALRAGNETAVAVGPATLRRLDVGAVPGDGGAPGGLPPALIERVFPRIGPDDQVALLHLAARALRDGTNFCRVSKQELLLATHLTGYRLQKALARLADREAITLLHRNTAGTLYHISLLDALHDVESQAPQPIGIESIKKDYSINYSESRPPAKITLRALLGLDDPAAASPESTLRAIGEILEEYRKVLGDPLAGHPTGGGARDAGDEMDSRRPPRADARDASPPEPARSQAAPPESSGAAPPPARPMESPVTEDRFPVPGTGGPALSIGALADRFFTARNLTPADHERDAALSQITLLLEDGFSREEVARAIDWYAARQPGETTLARLPYVITQALAGD